MKKIIPTFSILMTAILINACSYSSSYRLAPQALPRPVTEPNNIQVYAVFENKDYQVLGEVLAYQEMCEDPEATVKLLKKESALLGANAIIDLKLEYHIENMTRAIKGRGTAVYIPEQGKDLQTISE